MSTTHYEPLRIKAVEPEELTVLGACLQDALVPLAGMNFDAEKGQFYFVANRFCWECHPETLDGQDHHHRVQSGFHVDHVTHVREKGVDRSHPDGFMNLLTVHNPKKECVSLVFSGGAEIELSIDELSCRLHDLDEPYLTPHKPHHGE